MLDRAELTGLIRQMLGPENVELCDYTIHAIAYDATNPVSGGVYRVSGNSRGLAPDDSLVGDSQVIRAPQERVGRMLRRRLPG